MNRASIVAAALVLLITAGMAAAAGVAVKRSIAITGTSESGGVVTVKVKISGWKMYPALMGAKTKSADGGHWHIYVDGQYNVGLANAKSGRTTKLAEGKHALYVELVNNDHSSLAPPVRSRPVSVTIAATSGGGGEPPMDPGYGSDPYGG